MFDDKRPGWPTSTVTVGKAGFVKELLDNDRWFRVRSIAEELPLSYYTVQCILADKLNISKVAAIWVPRFFTEDNIHRELECSRDIDIDVLQVMPIFHVNFISIIFELDVSCE